MSAVAEAREPEEARAERAPRHAWSVIALTLGAIAVTEALARFLGPTHGLQRVSFVLVLAVVVATAAAFGLRTGLAAAVFGAAYAFYFYFRFSTFGPVATRAYLGIVVAALTLALAALVGYLRTRADRQAAWAIRTEREASVALREQATALSQRTEELESAVARLREANETLEAFSFMVSHDLKQPVRALDSLVQALEEDEAERLSEDGRDMLKQARKSVLRLSHLVAGLLDLSRASRIGDASAEPVSVRGVLESPECEARYRDLVRDRGARLVVAEERGTPRAVAPRAGLAQVLGNLVLNAVRHNAKVAPVVLVHVAPASGGDLVEVSVEDDGPGFNAEALGRFESLVRGGERPRSVGGFGLLIVQRTVDHMGGAVWVGRSEELGGASVRFTLPAEGAARAEHAARASAGDGRRRPRSGHRPEERI